MKLINNEIVLNLEKESAYKLVVNFTTKSAVDDKRSLSCS